MSDFLLDFRDSAIRRHAAERAASMLSFCEDARVERIERSGFSLTMTRVDDFLLWGPARSRDDQIDVILGGRIAMEEAQWAAAEQVAGSGGLACRSILGLYQADGIGALHQLNGNFAVIVADQLRGKAFLITDRCGMYMCYGSDLPGSRFVFSSHPDVLAAVTDQDGGLDKTSLTEFLLAGSLSFPHTYYNHVKALQPGSVYTIDLGDASREEPVRETYFRLEHHIDASKCEDDLAHLLAEAFRSSVRRRTLPRLGRVGVGLSGGLDSRAIVGAAPTREHLQAFCLYDEKNCEFHTAQAIARAYGIAFHPLKREFDHYGNSAVLGARIGGGTGCLASNHFLGVRSVFRDLGFGSIITGCYCDYLFKALALNTREKPVSRRQQLAGFDFSFYRPFYRTPLPYAARVQARLRERFPESEKDHLDEDDWLSVERKRSFPLAYEGDQAQRVIAQRILPWYLPFADNDMIDVYLQIPSRFKLNVELFSKMLPLVCGRDVCRIPDSNTGAPVNASGARFVVNRYLSALQERALRHLTPGMALRGSWPNWTYYVQHSDVVRRQWTVGPADTWSVLGELLGTDPRRTEIGECSQRGIEWFLRLWTLKLWLDQRGCGRDVGA